MNLQKTCGRILFIKSIVLFLSTLFFFLSGAVFLSLSKEYKDAAVNDTGLDCSNGLSSAILQILAMLVFILATIFVIITIVYFICSRKILRLDFLPKGATLTMIIFEFIFIITSIIGACVSIFNGDKINIPILIISIIVLVQASFTSYLLIKLKNEKVNG